MTHYIARIHLFGRTSFKIECPHNSRMDTAKLQQAFGLKMPSWEIGVERMLSEVLEKT